MIQNARIVAKDVNPEKYHTPVKGKERGTPGFPVSSSSLRAFHHCPEKWRCPILNFDGTTSFYERPGTEATEYGNLFDAYLLTPAQFGDRYAVIPPDAPRKPSKAQLNAKKPSPDSVSAMEWWEKFNKENAGKITVSDLDIFNVRQASKRFLEFPGMARFIDSCDKQVWIEGEWFDEETKITVPTKCLIDLLPNLESEYAIMDPIFGKTCADLKTTKDAHPRAWERWAHFAGYEIQAGWNCLHAMAADGRNIESFAFLLSENHAPWQPARRRMTLDPIEKTGDVDAGIRRIQRMMADYCKCLKTGKWFAYDDHDEASNGWTEVRTNPYQETAEQFAPKFEFEEEPEPEVQSETPT